MRIMSESVEFCGTMHGHSEMVTAIATPMDINNSDIIVTSSRDKSIIMWDLTNKDDDNDYGVPRLCLTGHSSCVQDVTFSSDAQYALSSSSDGELRLWDLADGICLRRFIGHKKEVVSVAFSLDCNRQIASASHDRTIKLWNIRGECKYTIEERGEEDGEEEGDEEGDGHSDWVNCVRFGNESLVSCSRDGTIKVWDLKFNKIELRHNLEGHTGYVNCIGVSPDGTICASGGDDGVIPIWDLAERKRLFSFYVESNVHALCFCPTRYWLCAATDHSIRIWDLNSKDILHDLKVPIDINEEEEEEEENDDESIYCTSLSWSADGNILFSGYSDGVIRVFRLVLL